MYFIRSGVREHDSGVVGSGRGDIHRVNSGRSAIGRNVVNGLCCVHDGGIG